MHSVTFFFQNRFPKIIDKKLDPDHFLNPIVFYRNILGPNKFVIQQHDYTDKTRREKSSIFIISIIIKRRMIVIRRHFLSLFMEGIV